MKTLAILSMTFLLAGTVAWAQVQIAQKQLVKETKSELKTDRKALRKLDGTTVNVLAKDQFSIDFGNVNDAVWYRSANFDEASFTKDGQKLRAFYDYDAKLVGTTTPKTFPDLPAKAQKEIKSKYKDYSVSSVLLFDDNEANETDMILYGIQFDDADHYFVELAKGNARIVLMVDIRGAVSYFTRI
jgi:hypothetical protein